MAPQRTIYLVDDDEDDRFFITEAVNTELGNVIFREFTDGLAFIQHVAEHGLQGESILIVMDINMPKMSGLETIASLKSQQSFSGVPVVMISTSSSHELIETSLASGASAFMVKPDSVKGLREAARTLQTYFSPEEIVASNVA